PGAESDTTNALAGFGRNRQRPYTTLDGVPVAFHTFPTSINPTGEITGRYFGTNGIRTANHGFVRDRRGTITSFDPPGSLATFATSINPAGEITGYYRDSTGTAHGFVRGR